MQNPIPYIQFFIIIQSVLFLFYLAFNQRLQSLSNRLLGLLILVLATHMSLNLFGQNFKSYVLADIAVGLGYCYGPLLYLYSRSLTDKGFSLSGIDTLHFLAPLIATLLAVATNLSIFILAIGIFVSLSSYSIKTWYHLKRYRYVLSQTRSEFEQIALRWLSNLLILQFGLLALNIASVSLYANDYDSMGLIAEVFLFSGLWLLVSMMIFQGMQHPQIFAGITKADRSVAQVTHSSLSEEMMEQTLQRIEHHLNHNHTYLKPDLTVKALGRKLQIIPKNISITINNRTGKNFSEYINGFRILHACNLLEDESQRDQSILDIMFESGFITKSNFNRAFKLVTGKTPFQYRQDAISKQNH